MDCLGVAVETANYPTGVCSDLGLAVVAAFVAIVAAHPGIVSRNPANSTNDTSSGLSNAVTSLTVVY